MSVPEISFPNASLRALLDRLIPAEEGFPGALDLGVEKYVAAQLEKLTDGRWLAQGLCQLDAEAGARFGAAAHFALLSGDDQDRVIADLEQGRSARPWTEGVFPSVFMARMIELAHEGFYADPGNGGNRDALAWQIIGYDPRIPPESNHS